MFALGAISALGTKIDFRSSLPDCPASVLFGFAFVSETCCGMYSTHRTHFVKSLLSCFATYCSSDCFDVK